MFKIKEESRRMIIQGEARFNGSTWFLGIGPLAFPLLIVIGAITGLLVGKFYLPDSLRLLTPDEQGQILVSAAGGVFIFVAAYALLAAFIRYHKRRITIDSETRTITWHDVFNRNWRFQRTFDEITNILVYKTKGNLLISEGATNKYTHRRSKNIYLPVNVYYAQFATEEKACPLMSGRNRKQVQKVAKQVAEFIQKPLEDRSDEQCL